VSERTVALCAAATGCSQRRYRRRAHHDSAQPVFQHGLRAEGIPPGAVQTTRHASCAGPPGWLVQIWGDSQSAIESVSGHVAALHVAAFRHGAPQAAPGMEPRECVDCKLPTPSAIRLIPQAGDCSGRWLLLQSTHCSRRRSTCVCGRLHLTCLPAAGHISVALAWTPRGTGPVLQWWPRH
jgi:hypothetical protein